MTPTVNKSLKEKKTGITLDNLSPSSSCHHRYIGIGTSIPNSNIVLARMARSGPDVAVWGASMFPKVVFTK